MRTSYKYLGGSAALAAAFALLSAILASTDTPASAAPEARAPRAAHDTQEQVGELRASLRHLTWRLLALETQRSAASDEPGAALAAEASAHPPEPVSAAPPTTDDRKREVERKASLIRDNMERLLAEQPADTEWQRDSLRQANGLFERFEIHGSRLDSVDCGQSVCRVSLQHDDEVARLQFVQSEALMEPPFNTELFGHYDSEAGATRIYLARHGEHLPPLEQHEL